MSTQESGIRFRGGRVLDFLGTDWDIEVDEEKDQVMFSHENNGTHFVLDADGGFGVPGDFELLSDLVFSDTDWSIGVNGNDDLVFSNSVSGSEFLYESDGTFNPDDSYDFSDESVEFSDVTVTGSITDAAGTVHTVELLDRSMAGTAGGVATLDDNGLIDGSHLPELAINEVFVTEPGETRLDIDQKDSVDIQQGDVVIETDADPSEIYIFRGGDTSVEDRWELVGLRSESVTEVFGRTGAIEPQAGDYDPSMVGVEGEAVAIGAPTVQTISDLPDPDSYPLGTRFFVLDENESFEVRAE